MKSVFRRKTETSWRAGSTLWLVAKGEANRAVLSIRIFVVAVSSGEFVPTRTVISFCWSSVYTHVSVRQLA